MGQPERKPDVGAEGFFALDLRAGRVTAVEEFLEARKPSWKLSVDFGPAVGELQTSAQITNYSRLASVRGLILHTSVGVGYEVPWRQVEAMLLQAAERTGAVLKAPPPYVLIRSLDDFAIKYELNAFVGTAQQMLSNYAGLHRNILDVFNEYGVQIMTPHFESQPERRVLPQEPVSEVPHDA